jgi:hypothetical protein
MFVFEAFAVVNAGLSQVLVTGNATHGQVFRNPFEAHGAFFSDVAGRPHSPFVGFARRTQVSRLPRH